MADTIWNGGAAALHCKITTYFYYFIFNLSILIYKIYKTFMKLNMYGFNISQYRWHNFMSFIR